MPPSLSTKNEQESKDAESRDVPSKIGFARCSKRPNVCKNKNLSSGSTKERTRFKVHPIHSLGNYRSRPVKFAILSAR